MFKFRIVLMGVLLACLSCASQTLKFENFTTKNGLLSDEVYNLHQDQKGYIWVFTDYGALKYNSASFKPVLTNLPFNESFIYCIYENSRGEKWIANSNAKIYRIINDSAFIVKGTEAVSETLRKEVQEISELFVDDSLNIYTITKKYSYKLLNTGKNTFKQINLSNYIRYDSIAYQVKETPAGLICAYNFPNKENYSLFCREGAVGILLDTKTSSKYYEVSRISLGGLKHFKKFDQSVYFIFNNFFGRINEEKKITYTNLKSPILNYTRDKNGHMWVGCFNGGLYELDEKDSIVNHYLGDITINDVLTDRQLGLWASSPGKGLFHCVNLNDRHFTENQPLGASISLLKIIDNYLWVSNTKGEIFRIKNGKIDSVYKCDIPSECLDILKFDQDYFFSMKAKCIRVHVSDQMPCRIITTIKGVANGIKMYGNNKDSVIYLHRKGIGFVVNNEMCKRIDLNRKTFGCEYRKNLLYIATDNGVFSYGRKIHPDPLVQVGAYPIVVDSMDGQEFPETTANSQFKTVVKDRHENLWFCSWGNGLFIIDTENKVKHYTVKNGLPSNIVNNVIFNNNGLALLCTNVGLFWFNDGNAVFDVRKLKCVYRGDVKNAVFFEGRIYIATNTGLIVLDRGKLGEAENVPFNLASILVNSKEINSNVPLEFKYYENNLEFDFDVISFSEGKNGLTYRLSGPSSDSGTIASHTLKFQNLKPGRYRLVVFPDVQNGGKVRLVISFVITPAFWQTTLFYVALSCLILILIIVCVLLVFRQQKKKADKKIKAEKLILEYKLIALKAQINPHFISNCLTAIQHLIIYNKLEAAADYVAKFGFFVRQILNFSTRSLVSIKEEIGITTLNLELEQLRFDHRFSYVISIGENIDVNAVFIPSLILNPIIENAIWHGLLPLRNKRQAELLLSVNVKGEELFLLIEDNGVGRRRDVRNFVNTRESRGVNLIEQRLSNINYLYGIASSRIIYEDLYDEQNEPKGTRVTIILPINLVPLHNE